MKGSVGNPQTDRKRHRKLTLKTALRICLQTKEKPRDAASNGSAEGHTGREQDRKCKKAKQNIEKTN